MSPLSLGLSFVLMAVQLVFAVAGNCAIIVFYVTDSQLRSVHDLYIFNLALTDFQIGCISLMFYAVNTLRDLNWIYSDISCTFWLIIDLTLCLESVLLILLISIDRLALITYGPVYISKMTIKRVQVIVLATWCLSFLVYGPSLLSWNNSVGNLNVTDQSECDIVLIRYTEQTKIVAFVEFLLPAVCLIVCYVLIYRRLKHKLRVPWVETLNVPSQAMSSDPVAETSGYGNSETRHNTGLTGKHITTSTPSYSIWTLPAAWTARKYAHHDIVTRQMSANMQREYRYRKGARFVDLLVAVFLITWIPYMISTVVVAFCENDCVNRKLHSVFHWIVWSKSAIYPFLYAIHSSRYWYHFHKLFTTMKTCKR